MKSETSATPGATADQILARASATARHRPRIPPIKNGALTALLVLAVFYTLYITRELTLPIVLALLFALLLSPMMRALMRLRIPRALAAAIVVLGLLGGLTYAAFALSGPASLWLQKSPELLTDLERKLRPLKRKVEEVDKAAQQVEKITQAPQSRTPTVQVRGTGIRQYVLAQASQLLTSGLLMFFLLYFMLATGDRMLERGVALLPSPATRQHAKAILTNVGHSISAYLSTMAAINIVFGAATALLMYALGMPNPVLWGALAAVLNFVPYLGALVTVTILSIVAVLTFDELGQAMLVPAAFLILNSLEGDMVTPWFLGRRLSLNPLGVFVGLVFWAWLWGPVGAFLSVPILVTVKAVCDNIERLRPYGRLLAH